MRRRACLRRAKTTHRSEEHTSELQSQSNIVCRLLLEKKKTRPHSISTRVWFRNMSAKSMQFGSESSMFSLSLSTSLRQRRLTFYLIPSHTSADVEQV